MTSATLTKLCRLLCDVDVVVAVVTVSFCCSSSVIVDPQLHMNKHGYIWCMGKYFPIHQM